MERRLILLRHAKSSWKEQGQRDQDRPLNKRGRRDAPRVAARLVELGWSPERVLLSDARRTRETWELMRSAFHPVPAAEERPGLYLAGLEAIKAEAGRLPPTVRTALLLGHNPGWEEAASALSGEELAMTTANAVLLQGQGETWAAALAGPWRRVDHLRPKELPGAGSGDDHD